MGDHFAHRLVVGDHPWRRRIDAKADRFAVDLDMVAELDALTDMGWLVIDRDAPFQDQLLHFQARAHARLGQHLVQLGRFGLRGQNPLSRYLRQVVAFGVESAAHDVLEQVCCFQRTRGRAACLGRQGSLPQSGRVRRRRRQDVQRRDGGRRRA